jgi:Cu/Zn superoxide dismutase
MNRKSAVALGASAVALIAATTMAAGPAQARDSKSEDKTVTLTAKLRQLNGSGASATATAVIRGETIKHIEVHAKGLTPDAPHAQHIHYGEQAMNECPTLKLDVNKDGRLTTVEGVPAYGPVVVSLAAPHRC